MGTESNMAESCATLVARVVNSEGKPTDATVLLHASDGSSQPLNVGFGEDAVCVQPGWYRITAESGMARASQEFHLDSGLHEVTLRLDTTSATQGGKGTISAAALRVPGKARKALDKARALIAKLHYDEALRFIGQAMEIYPQSSEAYQLRGLVSLLHHQQVSAISDFQRSIALDANNPLTRVMMAAALNDGGKFKEAVGTLQAALPLAPNSWQVQYELGRAYAGMGKLPDALHALTRGLELNPNFAQLRLARGMVLLRSRQFSEATADLTAYVRDDPNGADVKTAQQLLATAKAGARLH